MHCGSFGPAPFSLTVPVAPALHYLVGGWPLLEFATGAFAIAVLADWVRRGTEHVSTLVTHRNVCASGTEEEPSGGAWPLPVSLGVLAAATVVIALEAELVSGALEAASTSLGLSEVFLGVIVLALIGTASDLFAGALFARQGRMGLVLSICIGSAIQVALVLAPLLVLISWAPGKPMTLVFSNPLGSTSSPSGKGPIQPHDGQVQVRSKGDP